MKIKKKLFISASAVIAALIISACEECDGSICSGIQSGKAESLTVPADSLVLKVYVENSGSMNGYVTGTTQFESAIYSMLGFEENHGGFSKIYYNYINSGIVPINRSLDNYIANLEPASFCSAGGNLGTSDIKDLLDKVLGENDKNTVSIFISDCILSPGSGKNAADYIHQQEIGIRTSFSNILKGRPELMASCYQMNSNFTGKFYDKVDHPYNISNIQRPYYIWFFGDRPNVLKAQSVINIKDLEGRGLENILSFSSTIPSIAYSIISGGKRGDFKRCVHSPQKHILGCQKASGGKFDGMFAFTIEADLSNLPVSEAYLCDESNYQLSSKDYMIKIQPKDDGKYQLQISLKPNVITVNHTDLKIKILNKVPSWVETKHDSVGDWTPDVYDKTYGIKNIVDGIYQSYLPTGNNDETNLPTYATIRVIINY